MEEKHHSRSKAGKSFWKLNPHLPGIIVTAVFTLAAVWAFLSIERMKILPTQFLIALGVLFGLLAVLVGLLSWNIGKKARFVSSLVMTVLISALFLTGSTILGKVHKAITDIIVNDKETVSVAVYVNTDDAAQTLNDIRSYEIGYSSAEGKEARQAAEQLNAKLGTTLSIKEYDGAPFLLFDALRNHELGAILVSQELVEGFSDIEGFENLTTELRSLDSFKVAKAETDPMTDGSEPAISSGDVYTEPNPASSEEPSEDVSTEKKTAEYHSLVPKPGERSTDQAEDITEPTTEEPTTPVPTTKAPTTSAPTTKWVAPSTKTPTTQAPTTSAPAPAQTGTIRATGNSFIIYISGIDSRSGPKARSLSDVNILAVVNPNKRQILLINTPRDYYVYTTVSGWAKDKLTHAGMYGVECSKGTMSKLYDVQIDYYFRVDCGGFVKIIDALGGVDVYSSQAFSSRGYSFTVGTNHMNGNKALAFVRERKAFYSGDIQRGQNQMQLIKAVLNKLTSTAVLSNFNGLVSSLSSAFATTMPYEKMASLVQNQLSYGGSWSVETYSVTGSAGYQKPYSLSTVTYVMYPNDSTINTAKNKMRDVLN